MAERITGGEGRAALVRVADRLGRQRIGRKPFSALILMTDPTRTPDPLRLAAQMPPNSALIYRAFGAADALATGQDLRALTRRMGVQLLIGADERLAKQVGADGLHLPERIAHTAPAIRARHRNWIITAAAHSAWALHRADLANVDAILLSAVFPSRSPSAGRPLGPMRFAVLARQVDVPVLALGGVTAHTAPRLLGTGAAGLAGVDAWSD